MDNGRYEDSKGQRQCECLSETAPFDEDVSLAVTGSGRALQAPAPMQAYPVRLGQFEQGTPLAVTPVGPEVPDRWKQPQSQVA